MTTIDFYTHCADRFEVAAKIVAKAWAQHGSVRVLTPDAVPPTRSDGCCGSGPPTGFLPHCRLGQPAGGGNADLVDHALEHDRAGRGAGQSARAAAAVLFSRFERLAEIVGLDEAESPSGRERWKFYRARGYEMRSHNLARASVAVPSARELLEQADALMRRNRAGVIDTEIPELTEMAADGRACRRPHRRLRHSAPAVLDDVPELTEAVEEIEIESIVELPEDLDESSGWLHHDHGELSVVGPWTGLRRGRARQDRTTRRRTPSARARRSRSSARSPRSMPPPPVVAPADHCEAVEPQPPRRSPRRSPKRSSR